MSRTPGSGTGWGRASQPGGGEGGSTAAGGAEVLIDRERFAAGRSLLGQMDDIQDSAEVNVLVFSPDYLKSAACVHEMERAVARDPRFENGTIVPLKRVDVALPTAIRFPN